MSDHNEWVKNYCNDDGTIAVALDCQRCYIHVDGEKFLANNYDSECKGRCRHPSNVVYVDFKASRQSTPNKGNKTK